MDIICRAPTKYILATTEIHPGWIGFPRNLAITKNNILIMKIRKLIKPILAIILNGVVDIVVEPAIANLTNFLKEYLLTPAIRSVTLK